MKIPPGYRTIVQKIYSYSPESEILTQMREKNPDENRKLHSSHDGLMFSKIVLNFSSVRFVCFLYSISTNVQAGLQCFDGLFPIAMITVIVIRGFTFLQ